MIETFVGVLTAMLVRDVLRKLHAYLRNDGYASWRRGERMRWRVRRVLRPVFGWNR